MSDERAVPENREWVADEPGVDLKWVHQSANRAILWTLIPFSLPVIWFLGFRMVEAKRGVDQLESIAKTIGNEIRKSPSRSDKAIVDSLVEHAAYEPFADKVSVENYRLLVRTIYNQIKFSQSTPEVFLDTWRDRIGLRLYSHILGIGFVLAVIILFFPGTLINSVLKAKHRILERITSGPDPKRSPSFAETVRYRRYLWLLKNESQPLFFRRFAFAWMLAIGLVYLFAPGGIVNSTAVAYLYLNAPPTEPALPIWFNQFKSISPVLAGFAGFLIYAITVFVNQHSNGTLSHRTLSPLFVRGITVAIFGLLLEVVPESGPVIKALAFIIGVFPQAGIEAFSNLATAGAGRFTSEPVKEFSGIPEIDVWKEVSLKESGIRDPHDLAKSDLMSLAITTGINPSVLVDAVDRAILLHVLGIELTKKLTGIPIFRATQFLMYLEGRRAYQDRSGQGPSYKDPVDDLTDKVRQERRKIVADCIGIRDPYVPLLELKNNANVAVILDGRRTYVDL